MSDIQNGDDLQQLFGELRAHERARTPSFRRILERRPSRHPGAHHALAYRLAAAAAALALIVVLVWPRPTAFVSAPTARDPLLAGVMQLLEWRSPTESLLRTPGQQLWESVPSLQSSILDREVPPPRSHNGG